jgi:hypothetical protein
MSEPLIPEREAEIRTRAEAATPGPWSTHEDWPGRVFSDGNPNYLHIARTTGWNAEANERFISHARDDVPALLAEIDRLRARVTELERPAVEAERAEVRQSYMELSAQAREDRDYEGAFNVDCSLREREEQWARQDAADIRELVEGGDR